MGYSAYPSSGDSGASSNVPEVISGYLDSMAIEQPELGELHVVDGKVYRFVEAVGGGDIHWYSNSTMVTLNCTTNPNTNLPPNVQSISNGRAGVEVPQGTFTSVKMSVVCATLDMDEGDTEEDADVLLSNFEELPHGQILMLSVEGIQNASTLLLNGPIISQRTTECISHGGQSAISHMRTNVRMTKTGPWWTGLDAGLEVTEVTDVRDTVNISVSQGLVFQLHPQKFPAMNSGTDAIYYIKQPDSIGNMFPNYTKLFDIGDVPDCKCGTATHVDGSAYYLDVFGHVNYTEGECKLFVTQPTKVYSTDSAAIEAAATDPFTRLPWSSRTVGFHICRIVLRYNSVNNGTFTNLLSFTSSSYQQWRTVALSGVNSPNYPNNYPINSNTSYEILAPIDTNLMKLTFEAFNTEANYDFCKIYKEGNASSPVATFHGNLGTGWDTPGFSTRELTVKFTSDGSVGRTGYRVSSYSYRKLVSSTTNGTLVRDMRE